MFTITSDQIAEIIKAHQVDSAHCEACEAKRVTLELMALDFAETLERNNPQFKRDHFYTAAGFNL